jgi:hypothetical protein
LLQEYINPNALPSTTAAAAAAAAAGWEAVSPDSCTHLCTQDPSLNYAVEITV